MSKSVIIRGITYPDVPSVDIPLASGSGNATFYDVSDGTLTSGDEMLAGVTAYSGNVKITGTIPTKTSSDLTASGATVTVPSGYYASDTSKAVASGSVTAPSTISGTAATGVGTTNTITLTKTISVTPNVTTAGYISSGTAGNATVSLTATDADFVASNIVAGKAPFGLQGTATMVSVSQDSVTKVLTIA